MFTLHERLRADTAFIARLDLCRVLLMKDASFPWLILVPERSNVGEIHDLTCADRSLLIEEIACASRVLARIHTPDKINVGALGNRVPQLHIHVIARFRSDRAWPGPVWASGSARAYGPGELEAACERLRRGLAAGC